MQHRMNLLIQSMLIESERKSSSESLHQICATLYIIQQFITLPGHYLISENSEYDYLKVGYMQCCLCNTSVDKIRFWERTHQNATGFSEGAACPFWDLGI